MNISDKMRGELVTEFNLIIDKMNAEKYLIRKIWFFSGTYSMVNRVLNFEYDRDLVFLHQGLQTAYKAIFERYRKIAITQGAIELPENFLERLVAVLGEITIKIREDKPFYTELRTLSTLTYLTTGNGYYLSQKGVSV